MKPLTYDDLKRLKEFGPEWELSYEMLAALLNRLEAAEKCAELYHDDCEENRCIGHMPYWEWRKAAGR